MLRSLSGNVATLCLMAACLTSANAQTKDVSQKTPRLESVEGIEKIGTYPGSWSIHIEHLPRRTAATSTHNCGTTVGGAVGISRAINTSTVFQRHLIVFTFDPASGKYTTYPIPTDGSAARSRKLEIQDKVWTFPWETKDGNKTTYFRVVNVFTAPDTIEYRQEFSVDK
jgi:hypothetical protein